MSERRNVPEIVIAILRIASQIPNSDQSPLYDVKNPARASVRTTHAKRCFRGRIFTAASSIFNSIWWSQTGSNRRPHACKARALPAELWPRTRRRMLHVGCCALTFAGATAQQPSFKRPAGPKLQSSEGWWAWEDLNFRPHAYQARALTN
jgi:hypothetical protein